MLRAIAALLVLLYHVELIELRMIAEAGGSERPVSAGLWTNGFAGVDMFFVISGFVMAYVSGRAQAGPATAGAFLFARVARVYPAWWLYAGLAMLAFTILTGMPWNAANLSDGVSPAWHLIASFALLPQPDLPVLIVGWTLVHEMHFYLVFCLLLLMPYRFRLAALVLWAGIVIAGALAGASAPYPATYLQLATHPLSLEFLLGAAAATAAVNGVRIAPGLATLVGAVGFAAALILYQIQPGWALTWERVIWFGLPAALLVYGIASLEILGRLKAPPLMVALGDWSYALYLGHILVLSTLRHALPRLANLVEGLPGAAAGWADYLRVGAPGPVDNLLFSGASIIASLIVAWATFRYFERPALHAASALRRRMFTQASARLQPVPIRAAIW